MTGKWNIYTVALLRTILDAISAVSSTCGEVELAAVSTNSSAGLASHGDISVIAFFGTVTRSVAAITTAASSDQ